MRKLASPQLAAKMASKGLSYKEIGRRLEIAPDHAEWLVKKHRLGYSTAPKTIREDERATMRRKMAETLAESGSNVISLEAERDLRQ